MKPYYSDGGITIYHGDCLSILYNMSIDGHVCITDPPYGINYSSNHTCTTTTADWMNKAIRGDDSVAVRDAALSRFVNWACFGSLKAQAPHEYSAVLVWDKGPASGMGDLSFPWKPSFELVFLRGNDWTGPRDEGVIKGHWIVTRASMGRVHPNEKPVSLMAHFISKSPRAAAVCDPFMGSGTTLVAAKQLGRKAIGIEIEEKYCEIAAKRLAQQYLSLGFTQ